MFPISDKAFWIGVAVMAITFICSFGYVLIYIGK